LLKLVFYLALTLVGTVSAFFNPLCGAMACVLTYLTNPNAIEFPGNTLQYQLYVSVAFLAGSLLQWRPSLPRVSSEGNVLIALWVFVAIAVTSAGWAAYSSEIALKQVFELFKTILVAILLPRTVRSERHLRIFMIACGLGVFHAALLHVAGYRLGLVGSAHLREYGVLPDGQTSCMLLFIPVLLIMAGTGTGIERVVGLLALPLALDSLVATYQRAGLVGLVGEMTLLMLFGGFKTIRRIVPVLVLGAVLFLFRFTPTDYWNWMSTITTPTEESSANSRFVIDRASFRMFLDHPILGVGYRNYPFLAGLYMPAEMLTRGGTRGAHNSFFTVLCETGILGFMAWMFAIFTAVRTLRRVRKGVHGPRDNPVTRYAFALEIGLYGWLINGCFVSEHEVDPAYWFLVLSVALVRIQYQLKVARAAASSGQAASAPAATALGRAPIAIATRARLPI
jgi:O-antigen ligase